MDILRGAIPNLLNTVRGNILRLRGQYHRNIHLVSDSLRKGPLNA